MTYTIGYIVGSISSTSINRRLAKALESVAPDGVTLVEIPIKDLPFYSTDYDNDFPQVARDFKQASVWDLRNYGFELRLAFEDDRRNVAMFRSEGVPCVYFHSGYYD